VSGARLGGRLFKNAMDSGLWCQALEFGLSIEIRSILHEALGLLGVTRLHDQFERSYPEDKAEG
jgi:hypothetical protein